MRKDLLRFTVLAAAVLAAGAYASPATAFEKKIAYTFSTAFGGSYCDGISLTTTDKQIYQGFQLDSDCDGLNDPAGGFVVRLPNQKVIETVTSFASVYPNLSAVYYINPTAKTWLLYFNMFDVDGVNKWVEINSGILVDSPPRVGRGGVSSLHPRRDVKLDALLERR